MTVLFGYQHVVGVPTCPCRDPGNYLMLEQPGADPLACVFRCWCGRTSGVTFDDVAERDAFIAAQAAILTAPDRRGGATSPPPPG